MYGAVKSGRVTTRSSNIGNATSLLSEGLNVSLSNNWKLPSNYTTDSVWNHHLVFCLPRNSPSCSPCPFLFPVRHPQALLHCRSLPASRFPIRIALPRCFLLSLGSHVWTTTRVRVGMDSLETPVEVGRTYLADSFPQQVRRSEQSLPFLAATRLVGETTGSRSICVQKRLVFWPANFSSASVSGLVQTTKRAQQKAQPTKKKVIFIFISLLLIHHG